jgi:uncharacterized protein (DUF2062 family)
MVIRTVNSLPLNRETKTMDPMPKDFIKKYMPDPEAIRKIKNLQFLGDGLHDPELWRLSRRSVSMAFAVGLFCAWIPVPGQMAISATGAFYFRANLPIAVGLVWITNPITMPALFYFAYLIGLNILNLPAFPFSLETVLSGELLTPFLVGCLTLGVLCSLGGYFGIVFFWQYLVEKKWAARKRNREL